MGVLIALAVAALVAVIVIKIVFPKIWQWLLDRQNLQEEDVDNTGFIYKKDLKDGKVEVCYGIFNKRTETLYEGVKEHAPETDEELKAELAGKELVLYG